MWLRLYDDLPDDAKLDDLSNDQRWLWVVLMCLASRAPTRGTLTIAGGAPVPMDSLTRRTGMAPDAISKTFAVFEQREMLHRDGPIWVLTHWAKLQYESSTKRTKEYRERKKSGESDAREPSQ